MAGLSAATGRGLTSAWSWRAVTALKESECCALADTN